MVLAQVCLFLESQISQSIVSILRVSEDGGTLEDCIGPNLPEEYQRALEGLPIAENEGSCGTAAFRREAVFVANIPENPLWKSYQKLALEHGIHACWSQPVITPSGQLMGSLAVSHKTVQSPSDTDRELLSRTAALAGVIIAFTDFETELLETHNYLDWVLSSTLGGVWDSNLTTGLAIRSPGFLRALGFVDNELGPEFTNWRDRIHKDDLAQHDRIVNTCIKGEISDYLLEYRFLDNHGSWRWLLERGQLFPKTPNSQDTHLRGFLSDITGLKESQQSLIASEQRFRDFAQTAADVFWEQDADLRFVWTSENAHSLVGIAKSNFHFKRRDELVSKEQLQTPHWQKHLAQLAAREPFSNFEYKIERPGLPHRFLQASGIPIYDTHGRFIGYRGTARNITEHRRYLDQITHDASHDNLTGLFNRMEFERHLVLNIADAERDDIQRAVCYLDLDRFKQVNDNAGHAAGDRMLSELTAIMRGRVRTNDVLARLGGDEFGLLLRDCPLNKALEICELLIDAVNNYRLNWQNQEFSAGMSVGIVIVSRGLSPNELLARADSACYAAKEKGGNCAHVFTDASDL